MNFVEILSRISRILIIILLTSISILLVIRLFNEILSLPQQYHNMTEKIRVKQYNEFKNADIIVCDGYVIDNPEIFRNKIISSKKVYNFYDCEVIEK